MPPAPMTATVSPGCTLARLSTAPAPVTTAHPMRHATSSGIVLRDHDGLALGDDGPLREHPRVGELERLLAADRERAAQLAHRVAAVGRLTAVARVAQPAAAERGEHDVVAHLHLADGVADLLDHTRALVPEHDGRGERDGAVEHRHVGVAEPGVDDPHHDLMGPWAAHLDVVPDLQLSRPDEPAH